MCGKRGAAVNHALFVATLYSVVLPGGRRLQMQELRDLATDIGLTSPQTVGSSGNLVFAADGRPVAALEQLLERCFERRFGKFVPVFVRQAGPFLALPSRDPFAGAFDPACISVRLMRRPCAASLVARLQPHRTDEELAVVAGDLWIGFPRGPAGSKIPSALSRQEASAGGTFRTLAMITRICDAVRSAPPTRHG